MSRPRRWSDADTIQVRDALALLHADPGADPGSVCPVCDQVALAEQRWLFWLGQEGYQDQGVLRQLRASLGLCPRTRRLLAMAQPPVATTVLANVVDAALHHLRGDTNDANDDAVGRSGCPACQELARSQGFALTTLLDGLADARVEAAYTDRGGLCLPHVLDAAATAEASAARLLVATLRRRLGRPGPAALATVAGRPGPDARPPDRPGPGPGRLDIGGPDATRRSRRGSPPGPPETPERADAPVSTSTTTSTSTLRQLRDDLAGGACPACLRAARMQRRYVAWLAADAGRARQAVAREGVDVCAGHLHDLAAADTQAAGAIAAALAERVAGELASFETNLAELPPATIGSRLLAAATQRWTNRPAKPAADDQRPATTPAATPTTTTPITTWTDALRPNQHALDEARHSLLRRRHCRICQERDATAARTLRLLDAALADPVTARAYEASAGLCARHALTTVSADHAPDAGRLVRQVAIARLGVLAWELDEAARKRAWTQRHEPPGPEADAWLRGPELVDGMARLASQLAEPHEG